MMHGYFEGPEGSDGDYVFYWRPCYGPLLSPDEPQESAWMVPGSWKED